MPHIFEDQVDFICVPLYISTFGERIRIADAFEFVTITLNIVQKSETLTVLGEGKLEAEKLLS